MSVPSPTPYTIVSQDANSTVWQREEYEAGPNGQTITHFRRYTEIATGLNYKGANGNYQPAQELINVEPDGTAAATEAQHIVHFPIDIANGQIELVTPEGKQLFSQPEELTYFDGTNAVVLGEITNSVGVLVGNNQVVYPNAFCGIKASLRYTFTRAGFEQDVILLQQPLTPEYYGLNADSARIQMVTEFFNSPTPSVANVALQRQAGMSLTDQNLSFGLMRMGTGRAFLLGQSATEPGAFVAKSWLNIDGRQFLVEEVPVNAIVKGLAALPLTAMNEKPVRGTYLAAGRMILPGQRPLKKGLGRMKLAARMQPDHGFVLDYFAVNSSLTSYTFRADSTYYISGNDYLYGTNTFEGGAILKYTNNASLLLAPNSNPNVENWLGGHYRPIIFTSKDDNTIGDTISGSTGNPTNNNASYLYFQDNSALSTCSLSNVRMSYAGVGVQDDFEDGYGVNLKLTDCQFVRCTFAYEGYCASVELNNCLFSHCYCVNGQANGGVVIMNQVTADNSWSLLNDGGYIEDSALFVTNTILSSITNMIALQNYPAYNYSLPTYLQNSVVAGATTNVSLVYSGNSFINASLSGLYQAVGDGHYYLATGSTFHNAGTANIDPQILSDLTNTTTYPPLVYSTGALSVPTNLSIYAQRDNTGTPDLGYHYDPLDYVVGGSDLHSNLTLSAGTAVGYYSAYGSVSSSGEPYGLSLNSGASFNTIGTATSPCWVVDYTDVQEGNGGWSDNGWMGAIMLNGNGSGATPQINSTFTKWGRPSTLFFRDNWDHGQGAFVNCEFYAGSCATYDTSFLYFTSCLFNREAFYCFDSDAVPIFTMLNCTFYNGLLVMGRTSGLTPQLWTIENTSFDGTGFYFADYLNGSNSETLFNYNAYNTNNLSGLSYSYPYGHPTNVLEVVGPNDQKVSAYNWQDSWFGNFYLPSESQLIQAGSTTANLLGLYYFTSQTNQTIDGNSQVNIGYHYVATDQSGNPPATFNDGIPDYVDDPNGNGAPNWWELYWFGETSLNATNLDSIGNTLLYDYENGIDPDIIQFSITVTNNYVNNQSVPAQLNVFGGSPVYQAVVVDDTNYEADATWHTFMGTNITLNLGSAQGWHDVWISLKGIATNATLTWQYDRLKVDFMPPLLVVTNPIITTVSVPIVQVQGYCSEELASISYDLSNALEVVTNQNAEITDQYYETNTFEVTTNHFECVDVPLTNGLNVITLHAADMAGNMTTTNIAVTLDYSSRTNPPTVNLYWPQDGTLICTGNYSWRGWVDDPTATVLAQMVDTNGDTNTYYGVVERGGNFWVENMTLSEGTNWLTLTVTDSAGNVSVTNITVLPGDVALTIDPPSSDQLWEQGITVTGTIDDPYDYSVWVNGVEATLDDYGNWTADHVYLPTGGTVLIQARAIPNTDNGGNGTGGSGGGPVTYDNLGNPDPPQVNDEELETDKPPRLYVEKYTLDSTDYQYSGDTNYSANGSMAPDQNGFIWWWQYQEDDDNLTWTDGLGGSADMPWNGDGDSNFGGLPGNGGSQASWPPSWWPSVSGGKETNDDDGEVDDIGSPVIMENCDLNVPLVNISGPWTENTLWIDGLVHSNYWQLKSSRHAHAIMKLQTGGKPLSHLQNLFQLSASATQIVPINDPPPNALETAPEYPVPAQNIQIMGKSLNANGNMYIVLPDNSDEIVTPQVAGVQYYTFNESQQKYHCYFTAYAEEPKPGRSKWSFYTAGEGFGHSWWSLSSDAPIGALQQVGVPDLAVLGGAPGYFPTVQTIWLTLIDVPGQLIYPNGGGSETVHRRRECGVNGLSGGLTYTMNVLDYPGYYDIFNQNCTTVAVKAGAAAGIALPHDIYPQNFGIDLNALPPDDP